MVSQLLFNIAQSAGAVKLTDCFSAEGKTPSMNVADMTQNSLMARFY